MPIPSGRGQSHRRGFQRKRNRRNKVHEACDEYSGRSHCRRHCHGPATGRGPTPVPEGVHCEIRKDRQGSRDEEVRRLSRRCWQEQEAGQRLRQGRRRGPRRRTSRKKTRSTQPSTRLPRKSTNPGRPTGRSSKPANSPPLTRLSNRFTPTADCEEAILQGWPLFVGACGSQSGDCTAPLRNSFSNVAGNRANENSRPCRI